MQLQAQTDSRQPVGSLEVYLKQSSPVDLAVRLSCKPGELLALVGPSGSGKSTVLRTIAGLQSVHRARVSCGDQSWLDTQSNINVAIQKRRVGLVFQHYALFPHKSALENVALAIQGGSRESRRQHALEWLRRTNMTGLESRKPDTLSGGQRQRIALARALAREPAVLLLDEPFSAVDQQTRRRLYRELAQLRSSLSIPMILVTHDISEVQQLADSLCLIHKGRTLQQGAVQDVISSPGSKTIARLLGHQNLIAATVARHEALHTVYQLAPDQCLLGPRLDAAVGEAVTLLIAPSSIDLHDTQQDAATNIIPGSIRDAVHLGDQISYRVHLDTVTKSLRFRLPLHQVAKLGLDPGALIKLRIQPPGIHVIREN